MTTIKTGDKAELHRRGDGLARALQIMTRDFRAKPPQTNSELELRDIVAMMIPQPPFTFSDPSNEMEKYMAAMRARYSMADRIIKEVR